MKLIVGLGNPGQGYANNRHNLGFMCLNHFARIHSIRFERKQGKARVGVGVVAGSEVMVAKPQTYMNLSGQAVSLLMKKLNIGLDDLLVVHDDLDLPLAKIRIRRGGGSGGHRGVDSITTELDGQDFSRIRVGIGRPAIPASSDTVSETDIISYVLGDFTPEEKEAVTGVIPEVNEAILCFLTEGLTVAMNRYN